MTRPGSNQVIQHKSTPDLWLNELRFDGDGLIPAVVQEATTKDVLMVAYMNRESLQKTIETSQTWFWSRSRQQLWHKGATSGHYQTVRSLSYDCDGDTLLIQVDQIGPACHTGSKSCFFRHAVTEDYDVAPKDDKTHSVGVDQAPSDQVPINGPAHGEMRSLGVLSELLDVIDQRYCERPAEAYTTYLFDKGLDKIIKKFGEEATEVIIAAKNGPHADQTGSDDTGGTSELCSETADLLFHLFVLLRQCELPLEAVLEELDRRFGRQHAWRTARNQ